MAKGSSRRRGDYRNGGPEGIVQESMLGVRVKELHKLSKLPTDGIFGPPMRLQNMEQVLERLLTGCYQRLRHLPVSQTVPTTQPMTERLNYVMRDYSKNELETRLAGRFGGPTGKTRRLL